MARLRERIDFGRAVRPRRGLRVLAAPRAWYLDTAFRLEVVPLDKSFEALVFYIVFVFSVRRLEAAHAWAASFRIGQVTSAASPVWESAAFVLSAFFSLNLILFILNILPVPPLDGSGALPLVMGRETSQRLQSLFAQPMVGMVGLLLVWRVFGQIFRPVFLFAVNLIYPGSPYG